MNLLLVDSEKRRDGNSRRGGLRVDEKIFSKPYTSKTFARQSRRKMRSRTPSSEDGRGRSRTRRATPVSCRVRKGDETSKVKEKRQEDASSLRLTLRDQVTSCWAGNEAKSNQRLCSRRCCVNTSDFRQSPASDGPLDDLSVCPKIAAVSTRDLLPWWLQPAHTRSRARSSRSWSQFVSANTLHETQQKI